MRCPLTRAYDGRPRVAEFFAGIGLVRMALESEGCRVVFANDIDKKKRDLYAANFDPSPFVCCDIRDIGAFHVPEIDIATASFPCTNLSLAGHRDGLAGRDSSILWKFISILDEMAMHRPQVVMLENVSGFATSNHGRDLRDTIAALNGLGYTCDVLTLDARHFVAQSRSRVFVIGSLSRFVGTPNFAPSQHRSINVIRFIKKHPELLMQAASLPKLPHSARTLSEVAEPIPPTSELWWDARRLGAFLASLSDIQSKRLESLRASGQIHRAAAYRRTRHGSAVWEIRADEISGCLRTARGGSSKQALVEAGQGSVKARWMTAREYATLQGAPDFKFDGASESQVRFAMGDGVCVPVVGWLARHYLVPLVQGKLVPRPVQMAFSNAS